MSEERQRHYRYDIDKVCKDLYEIAPEFDDMMGFSCPAMMKKWNTFFPDERYNILTKKMEPWSRYDNDFDEMMDAVVRRLKNEPEEKPLQKVKGKYNYVINFFDLARDEDKYTPQVVQRAVHSYAPRPPDMHPETSFFFRPAKSRDDDSDRTKVYYWPKDIDRLQIRDEDEEFIKKHARSVRIDRLIEKMNIPEGEDPRKKGIPLEEESPPPIDKWHLRRAMTMMPSLKEYNLQIEITDDPVDVFRRSEGQYWESCESLHGSYRQGVFDDVENWNGVAIVRAAPVGKPLPEKWTGRVSLKNCNALEDDHADVGIEARMYGGINAKTDYNKASGPMEKFVRGKIEEILEKAGLHNYTTCRTPYDYHGYSDKRSKDGLEQDADCDMPIDYGLNELSYEDYCEDEEERARQEMEENWESLLEEYDREGVVYCEGAYDDRNYPNVYYKGNLANMLGETSDNFHGNEDFEEVTGCTEVSEDDEGYIAWSLLPEEYEKLRDHIVDIVDEKRFVVLLPKKTEPYPEPEQVPFIIRYNLPQNMEHYVLDPMQYETVEPYVSTLVDCLDYAESNDPQEELERKEKCLLDHYKEMWGDRHLVVPDDEAEQEKFMEQFGDEGWRICAQVYDVAKRHAENENPRNPQLDYEIPAQVAPKIGDDREIVTDDIHKRFNPFGHYYGVYDIGDEGERVMALLNEDSKIPHKTADRLKGIRSYCTKNGGFVRMRDAYEDIKLRPLRELYEMERGAQRRMLDDLSDINVIERRTQTRTPESFRRLNEMFDTVRDNLPSQLRELYRDIYGEE